MKKIQRISIVLVVMALLVSVFVACGPDMGGFTMDPKPGTELNANGQAIKITHKEADDITYKLNDVAGKTAFTNGGLTLTANEIGESAKAHDYKIKLEVTAKKGGKDLETKTFNYTVKKTGGKD